MAHVNVVLGGRTLAIACAAVAMLAVSVRETAPERRPELSPPLPSAEALALMKEARIWLGPAGADGAFGGLASDRPFTEAVRQRRRSFEFFVRAAGPEAVRDRVRQVPYGERILAAAARKGVDPLLVAAIVQAESSFREDVVSHRGAVGLMQVMPRTAAQFGIADVRDPVRNLEAGMCYLAHLLERYDHDLVLALAAYNAGPGRVRRFDGVPPYPDTRDFIEKVLRRYVDHHRAALVHGDAGALPPRSRRRPAT